MGLKRFGVSMEAGLLEVFDRLIAEKGYENRSEAIRDLIRDRIVNEQWDAGEDETAGTVTLVYSHDVKELTESLTDLQHHHHAAILSTMHLHLDEHLCLEVLVVKGKSGEIRSLADRLIGIKGVMHGKLALTTTGRGIG
jgi:CopG family nickel-responsive transcriptional regulator